METVYTLSQIKGHWEDYQSKHCWKAVKHGGGKVIRMKAPNTDEYLQCKMVPLKSAIGFPRYLEIINSDM